MFRFICLMAVSAYSVMLSQSLLPSSAPNFGCSITCSTIIIFNIIHSSFLPKCHPTEPFMINNYQTVCCKRNVLNHLNYFMLSSTYVIEVRRHEKFTKEAQSANYTWFHFYIFFCKRVIPQSVFCGLTC
jgi:hypothetical protein